MANILSVKGNVKNVKRVGVVKLISVFHYGDLMICVHFTTIADTNAWNLYGLLRHAFYNTNAISTAYMFWYGMEMP
jgi:hypothetical protein